MSKEKPSVQNLMKELSSITEWDIFAIHLPNIELHHVRQIQQAQSLTIRQQQLALFEMWLNQCPTASWEDIKKALHTVGQNAVAERLPKPRSLIPMKPPPPPKPTTELKPTIAPDHLEVISSSSTLASTILVVDSSSTVRLEKPSVKTIASQFEGTTTLATTSATSATATPNEMPKIQALSIDDIPKNAEKNASELITTTSVPLCAVQTNLESLQKKFNTLVSSVHKGLLQKPQILASAVQTIEAMMPIKISSKEQLFDTISPHYDILDYQVVINIAEQFTDVVVISQLHEYNAIVKEYRESTPIQAFLEDLKIITESQLTVHLPKMIVRLEKVWINIAVNGLFLLAQNLLPAGYNCHQYSLLKHLSHAEVSDNYVVIEYGIHAHEFVEAMHQHFSENYEFLRLIGVAELEINCHQVLSKSENIFSFENSLLRACAHNRKVVVTFLADIGINLNYQDSNGLTAIKVASYFEHMDIVELLLSKNVDLNVVDSDEKTLLMFLIMNEKFDVALYLLNSATGRITIDAKDKDGWTALMISCQIDHADIVTKLLQKKADVNLQNNAGRTALMTAVQYCKHDNVELLLKNHANVNIQNDDGFTALMIACLAKKGSKMVEILLHHGANPNIQNKDGATALMFASQDGCSESVDALLADGHTDPNLQNKSKSTALMGATQEGFFEVALSLLQNGANPNIQNIDGTTALMIACRKLEYKIAQLLLAYNADPNIQDNNGLTALTVTCIASNEAPSETYDNIAKLLLKNKASPLVLLGDSGLTEFGNACLIKNTRMVDLYIKNFEIPISKIATCLYVACINGNRDVITLLVSSMPDIDPSFCQLLVACAKGDIGMVVHSSTELKVDCNACTVHKITPLMVASACGHSDVIDVLIQKGANITNEDDEGKTALDYATNSNHTHVASFLKESGGVHGSSAVIDDDLDMSCATKAITEFPESQLKHEEATKKLENLHKIFEELIKKVKESISEQSLVEGQLQKMLQYAAEYTSNKDLLLVETGEKLFLEIHPYYDFLNCHLVTDLVQKFIGGPLLHNLREHSTAVKSVCIEMSVKELISTWKTIKTEIDSHYLTSLPNIMVTLESVWANISIKGLFLLVEHLLPATYKHLHYSLIKHLSNATFSDEKPVIEYGIHQHVEDIKQHVNKIYQFVRLVGVIKLVINGQEIIHDGPNQEFKFTFEESLITACQESNISAVEFLLDIGANINYRDANGVTALRIACFHGNTDLIDLLLQCNADQNEVDDQGRNLVTFLLAYNKVDTALYLLDAGATSNINVQAKDSGYTALMVACASEDGSIEVMKSMLKNKANPDLISNAGRTALTIATLQNKPKAVELLLQENADPNIRGGNDCTALMLAAVRGYEEIVDTLMKNKRVDPNIQRKDGMTALIFASHEGHAEIVNKLLQKKANPNLQNVDGETALMAACEKGHLQIINSMLTSQADPDIVNNVGRTAMMLAIIKNKPTVVELLLQENADPNVKDSNEYTALMHAVRYGYEEIIGILLKFDNTNPDIQDKHGLTAIMFACHKGHINIAKALLQKNANPDIQNTNGSTALMIACIASHYEIAKLLLQHNADINIRNTEGLTALTVASMAGKDAPHDGYLDIIHLLLKNGASPLVQLGDDPYVTEFSNACAIGNKAVVGIYLKECEIPADMILVRFYFACIKGSIDLIVLLAPHLPDTDQQLCTLVVVCAEGQIEAAAQHIKEHSIDPNISIVHGVTPLMIAAACGHVNIIELLIQTGADANSEDGQGHTALDYATMTNHDASASFLKKNKAVHGSKDLPPTSN